jgi:hypothetical protein
MVIPNTLLVQNGVDSLNESFESLLQTVRERGIRIQDFDDDVDEVLLGVEEGSKPRTLGLVALAAAGTHPKTIRVSTDPP